MLFSKAVKTGQKLWLTKDDLVFLVDGVKVLSLGVFSFLVDSGDFSDVIVDFSLDIFVVLVEHHLELSVFLFFLGLLLEKSTVFICLELVLALIIASFSVSLVLDIFVEVFYHFELLMVSNDNCFQMLNLYISQSKSSMLSNIRCIVLGT